MRGIISKATGRFSKREAGFTLIELLVVIGIIVALAAITVPLVTKFIGSGKEAALKSETEAVQLAMNSMMADKGVTAVTANDLTTTSAVNTWTAQPTGTGTAFLGTYLKKTKTDFYYCWSANGTVWGRNETGKQPTADFAKIAGGCEVLPAP